MTTDDKIKIQYDVFLSYARADDDPNYDDPAKSFMRRLYNALTAEGFSVWWDREKMPNRGLTFSENIKRAVIASRRLILIVGSHALTSEYVTKEWHTALDVCVPVIPILRRSEYTDLPPELAGIDAPDFRNDALFDERITYLVRQLNEEVPPPGGLHGMEWFKHPQGYILRKELWRKLDVAVRGDVISAEVATSREQLTALQGIAGLGKTTIAAVYAESCAVRRTFDSGVFWLTVGRAADILATMTDLGGLLGDNREAYSDLETAIGRLSNLLENRRALIVLDDIWERTVIDTLRPTLGTDCRILFTTRDTRIVTLTQSQRIQVDTLNINEGVRLIGRWLNRSPQDDLAERNPYLDSERAIVDLLQGHTLAVNLAGARIAEVRGGYAPTMLSEYQRVRETENPFANLDMKPDDRNWSVEISLSLSYEALNDEGRRHFRALGVLAESASFSKEMLTALWEANSPHQSLHDLETTAMIEPKQDGSFGQHPVLRAYAAGLLRREHNYTATFARYADHVIEKSAEFERLLPHQWAPLEPLLPHVREVGDALTSLIYKDMTAAQLSSPFTKFKAYIIRVLRRRQRQRARDFVNNVKNYVIRRPQVVEEGGQKRLRGMGWLEIGLKIAQETGDKKREGLLYNELGVAWFKLGELNKALHYFEQALPLRRAANDKHGEAATLSDMGAIAYSWGKLDEALEYYEKARSLYQALDDNRHEAGMLGNIGLIQYARGHTDQARKHYEQALTLLRACKERDKGFEGVVLSNLGETFFDSDENTALKYFEQALPLLEEAGDEGEWGYTLNYIGRVWSKKDEERKALDYFEQALQKSRNAGDQGTQLEILQNMYHAYTALGDTAKAKEYLDLAERLQSNLSGGK